RHLRSRAVTGLRRRKSDCAVASGIFLCSAVGRVWSEPPRQAASLGTVDTELDRCLVRARVRLERRAAHSSFLLDVSVALPAGIPGLFGPWGAGKFTLRDCIAGLLHPDCGRIAIGEQVLFDSQANINLPPQKRGLAYVFQSLALFPRMTVDENVSYGLAGV